MHSELNWGRGKSHFSNEEKISTFLEKSQLFMSAILDVSLEVLLTHFKMNDYHCFY